MPIRKIAAAQGLFNLDEYVGEQGYIFYDVETGELRLSDGSTPGGFPLLTGGANTGTVKVQWNSVLNKPAFATVSTSGSYLDLSNRPVFSTVAQTGNYTDLLNKPTLFDGNYNSLSNLPTLSTVAFSGNYDDLANKPYIPPTGYILPAANNSILGGVIIGSGISVLPDGTISAFSGNYADLTNKPTDLSNFTNNAGYLTTSTVAGALPWSSILGKPTFGTAAYTNDYADLINTPLAYDLVPATTSTLGGIKVGTSLNITPTGVLSVNLTNHPGDIIPAADEVYDLGSPTKKFKDLYLSGSSIYLGPAKISGATGDLTVNGFLVSTSTLKVSQISESGTITTPVNNVNSLLFDDATFDLADLGNGQVKVTGFATAGSGGGGGGGGSSLIKTFNILNEFQAPYLGSARFVPSANDTVRSVLLTNGGVVWGQDLMVALYRNDTLLNFFSIPNGNFKAVYSNLTYTINTNDYLTVSVVSGKGMNFSMNLFNTII